MNQGQILTAFPVFSYCVYNRYVENMGLTINKVLIPCGNKLFPTMSRDLKVGLLFF